MRPLGLTKDYKEGLYPCLLECVSVRVADTLQQLLLFVPPHQVQGTKESGCHMMHSLKAL